MKLSRVERWMLSNQFGILAKLYPEEADSYGRMREIVEQGYEFEYGAISQYIYDGDDVMTRQECIEVIDILEMFTSLKRGYNNIDDKSGVDDLWVHFAGFDGNNETKQLAYARFLVEREDKFTDIDRGDRFNSHMPVLDSYRRMLNEWERSANKYQLTKADIVRITGSVMPVSS